LSKIASECALALDISQEQDFPESMLSQILRKELHADLLFWIGFSGEHAFHGFLDALAEMRTTLEQPQFTSHGNSAPESHSSRKTREQIAPRKIFLLSFILLTIV
jgi:hypothetical protein